jgi:myotubularin-related protein 10/11/12
MANEYPSSESALPQYYVVPKKMTDSEYFKYCNSFRYKRGAIWVWALGNASLVRMADLLPDLLKDEMNVQKIENLMLEHVVMCSEERKEPKIMELTKGLPSIQDVYQSYLKLRALCVPESDRELTVQDRKFYTLFDKTSWLLYVSLCMKTANEATKNLRDGSSVVLQENDGRDMSCLISSFIQVLLDPFYRTISGFQVLIQKEWIALGHPFCDRIGHIHSKQADRSPIFLLFLDCVWQTLQQFPESFEFSETFLTTIWDCVFLSVFDTFQFNCEYDRYAAIRDVSCNLHKILINITQ